MLRFLGGVMVGIGVALLAGSAIHEVKRRRQVAQIDALLRTTADSLNETLAKLWGEQDSIDANLDHFDREQVKGDNPWTDTLDSLLQ